MWIHQNTIFIWCNRYDRSNDSDSSSKRSHDVTSQTVDLHASAPFLCCTREASSARIFVVSKLISLMNIQIDFVHEYLTLGSTVIDRQSACSKEIHRASSSGVRRGANRSARNSMVYSDFEGTTLATRHFFFFFYSLQFCVQRKC